MNKIFLLGRLTKEPEVRITPTEKTVCTFALAVDRPYSNGKEREADFINVVTWGKTAEVCGNNVSKGQRLLVEGRLQIRKYQDRQGQNRYVTEVIADRVEFIERKEKTSQNESLGAMGAFAEGYQAPPPKKPTAYESELQFDEEIPF